MKLLSILLISTIFFPSLNYRFVQSNYDPDKINKWSELGDHEAAYKLYYLGSFCDMPIVDNMRMSVSKDTLFIFSGVPKHSEHKKIGESGIGVDLIINKLEIPNYKSLIIVRE